MERKANVRAVSFSPSGEHLAVGEMDKKVALLRISTWEVIHEVKRKGDVHSVCFGPSGEWKGREVSHPEHIQEVDHGGVAFSVCFSPSGDHLAVVGKCIYKFVQLGPRLSAECAPKDMVDRAMADESST